MEIKDSFSRTNLDRATEALGATDGCVVRGVCGTYIASFNSMTPGSLIKSIANRCVGTLEDFWRSLFCHAVCLRGGWLRREWRVGRLFGLSCPRTGCICAMNASMRPTFLSKEKQVVVRGGVFCEQDRGITIVLVDKVDHLASAKGEGQLKHMFPSAGAETLHRYITLFLQSQYDWIDGWVCHVVCAIEGGEKIVKVNVKICLSTFC